MENEMKMLMFKGIGSEDLEQFWFVANAVWTTKKVTNDNIKKAKLVTALQDRAITWYIMYCANNA